jgi:hypothetical protein
VKVKQVAGQLTQMKEATQLEGMMHWKPDGKLKRKPKAKEVQW